MRCFALHRTNGVVAHVAAGVNPAVAVSGYGPSDLDSAYSVPTTLGSGKTVAIVDAYDDPNAASDLGTYRSNFGLPPARPRNGCFKKVNQNGATSPLPAANTGWAAEDMLDIEMVSAICPNCQDPARRGEQPDDREPRHGRQHGRRAGRGRRLEQLRRLRDLERDELRHLVLQAPRRGDRRLVRRQRLHARVSGRVAVGDRRRRHRPVTGEQRARLDGVGLVDVLERGRGQRLLDLRGEAVVPDTTPAARGGRSPTSPRSPTRRPAWPSTTRTARAAGRCSAARASRRRSSARCTRWPTPPAAGRLSRTRTRTPTRARSAT